MSFHLSSKSIELQHNGHLVASCCNKSRVFRSSTLNLNLHLGNKNGVFEWGGVNFAKTARDVVVVTHGSSVVLHAKLRTTKDHWRDARVNLSNRIANHDGVLVYVGSSEPETEETEETKEAPSPPQEPDFLSSTFSDLKELANGLFMGGSSHNTSQRRTNDRFTSSGSTSTPEFRSGAESSFIHMEDTTSVRTPVPAHGTEIHEAPPSATGPTTDNAMTSEEREAKEHEQMVLESLKEFLFSGNGRSVHSFQGADGERTLEFRGDGDTRKLTIGGADGEILFNQDDYHGKAESHQAAGVEPMRCLTPETVEGEDDDFEMLV